MSELVASASWQIEFSGGTSIRLHVADAMVCGAAAERVYRQAYDVLDGRQPLSVTVAGLESTTDSSRKLAQLCEILRAAARDARVDAVSISIIVAADRIAPQLVWASRNEILGPGPVYLLMGNSLLRPSVDNDVRRRQDEFWLQFWQLRSTGLVRAAFAPLVTSPCPLLPSESADSIMPTSFLQAPAGTAWVPKSVNVARFANDRGEINSCALQNYLHQCIRTGDAAHDDLVWPTAAMRHDAWLNRRLAINVTGIGDLVQRRSLDPTSFATLKDLGGVLQEIRNLLCDYSRELALQKEYLPALDLVYPAKGPGCDVLRLSWQKRWRKALQFAAIRHRNLLAMSPWSMFPSAKKVDSRYCDLLPLLEHADVCSFPPPPCLQRWNINEFKYFHHRAWAVLEQKDARQLFAEQV